jgi:two-component system invasion response regulator UvrY
MIRVLLVDDHAVVRAGYHRFLERTNRVSVVAEAAEPEQGYALFLQHAPDVAIVDLSLPGGGGLELIRRMVAHEPTARVLVFSMHEDPAFASRALHAGARGYVTKRSTPETLVEAVLQLFSGHSFLSPDMAQDLAVRNSKAHPLGVLSTKELDIFRSIAEGQSVAQIAAGLNLSQKTVANYQTMIKEKLGASTSTTLVHLALRYGVIEPRT